MIGVITHNNTLIIPKWKLKKKLFTYTILRRWYTNRQIPTDLDDHNFVNQPNRLTSHMDAAWCVEMRFSIQLNYAETAVYLCCPFHARVFRSIRPGVALRPSVRGRSAASSRCTGGLSRSRHREERLPYTESQPGCCTSTQRGRW